MDFIIEPFQTCSNRQELEIRLETQKQTLNARDESIKKLLEMLQNKGMGMCWATILKIILSSQTKSHLVYESRLNLALLTSCKSIQLPCFCHNLLVFFRQGGGAPNVPADASDGPETGIFQHLLFACVLVTFSTT